MNIDASAAPPEARTKLPFSFTGTAREYFGIWIVNLLLSIVTLGIYTAWAKVRRVRYFYGNTHLDGHNFEYHAKPIQILIGRIIVVGILLAVNVLANFYPLVSLIILVPYLLALPWLINKAIRFNARMTSYRNIRLGFEGTYWGAFAAFIVMPIVVLVTGGILAPLASQVSSNYIGNGMRYGMAKFRTDAPLGALFANLGVTILFVIGFGILAGLAGFAISAAMQGVGLIDQLDAVTPSDAEDPLLFWGIMIGTFSFYIVFFFAFLFYRAGVRNVAYNATTIDGGHGLHSDLSRLRYFWIVFSNFFIVVATIGLMRPWAAIRTWRYTALKTAFLANGSMDNFAADSQLEGNVAAAEYLDIEGIDFGL